MRNWIAILLIASPLFANAGQMRIRCLGSSALSCESEVVNELQKQQCGVANRRIRCVQGEDAYLCVADVGNCADAVSDGFAGVGCPEGTRVKFNNRNLTADWAVSALWIWVKSFCKM